MQTRGFRRLVLATCAAGIFVAGGIFTIEVLTRNVGYFAEMTLPVGTVVNGSQATLPDGRVLRLDTTIAPRATAPGHIVWESDPAVAELHVQRLLLAVAVGIPLIAWLGIDALALTAAWIRRGFRAASARPAH